MGPEVKVTSRRDGDGNPVNSTYPQALKVFEPKLAQWRSGVAVECWSRSVFENNILRFFHISKNITFYVFFEMTCQKVVKCH